MYNVVIITIDSLRADFLECYNENQLKDSASPYLDLWAKEAVIFLTTISQSVNSSPSFLALFSGHYPCKFRDWFSVVSPDRTLAAEIFKNNGYFTCAFHSNPYLAKFFNWDKGFDLFEDNLPERKTLKPIASIQTLYRTLFPNIRGNAEQINKQVVSWLNNRIEPFFLWVHYMDVHGPYVSNKNPTLKNRISAGKLWRKALREPEKITNYEKELLLDSYREKLAYLDSHINELLKNIDQPSTIIVLTSDHGQCFGEHGSYDHPLELYEALIRVPLLIKFPSSLEIRNDRILHPVRSLDVIPTLVDMLSLRLDNDFDGQSLLPLINGNDNLYSNKYYISEVSRKHLSVRNDRWKLIVDYNNHRRQLFDLNNDPTEKINLAQQSPGLVENLEKIALEHINKYKPDDFSTQEISPDEKITAELQVLGYAKK